MLDDYEMYAKSRGITLENAIDLMKGPHVYNVQELKAALLDVENGKDEYKEQRREVLEKFHVHQDGEASKRIVTFMKKNWGF